MSVETDIRLLDPESMACLFAKAARLHAQDEAHHESGLGWVVSKYEDVQKLAKGTEHFSNHWHGLAAGVLMMGQSDEPFSPEVERLIAAYPHQMPNGLLLADAPVRTVTARSCSRHSTFAVSVSPTRTSRRLSTCSSTASSTTPAAARSSCMASAICCPPTSAPRSSVYPARTCPCWPTGPSAHGGVHRADRQPAARDRRAGRH